MTENRMSRKLEGLGVKRLGALLALYAFRPDDTLVLFYAHDTHDDSHTN